MLLLACRRTVLYITTTRVKAFFMYSRDKQVELIEAPSGAQIEQKSEDIGEADMTEAENAPTEYVSR